MEKSLEIQNKIPEWAREKIIHNVFCGSCSRGTTIIDYKIEPAGRKDDIVLRGKSEK